MVTDSTLRPRPTGDVHSRDRTRIGYLVPLRAEAPVSPEFVRYLTETAASADVVVVDGSGEAVRAAHRRAFPSSVALVGVDERLTGANGKVRGVTTGMRYLANERVVVADDDVRYTEAQLHAVAALLDRAEIVRPSNAFAPLPWHARWDSGRILLNRAVRDDWPGTLAVRRSIFVRAGGYDADVLFENLELVRTVRSVGGREHVAQEIVVRRLPPTTAHFLRQRVRQAYDEFARPWRLLVQLACAPLAIAALASGRAGFLAAAAVAIVPAAEFGRRRDGGMRAFPASLALWAPLWVGERAVTAWLAIGLRVAGGGVRYSGVRLRVAAHSLRALRAIHRTGVR